MEGVYVPCSGGFHFPLFSLLLYDNDVEGVFYTRIFGSTLFSLVRFGFLTGYILIKKNLSGSYCNSACTGMT